jgi:hypothetical protein
MEKMRKDTGLADLDAFNGMLPWSYSGNRPFLSCLHGCGLCFWRSGRMEEADAIFNRMLSLNPMDDQGARFLILEVRAHKSWEDSQGESNGL